VPSVFVRLLKPLSAVGDREMTLLLKTGTRRGAQSWKPAVYLVSAALRA
jgi:hypothetical protein